MSPQYKTIDEYIAGFPPEIQAILRKLRQIIRKAAPDAIEAISYQMPTFKLNGNLVHFAAFKSHIGFYPAPSGTEKFRRELAPYQAARVRCAFHWSSPFPMIW